MAALAETRDVGSNLPLPLTVRRLCCIGDSITYGQGVAPRQTLSAHITRIANMAYPDELIWVDNRGLSSGNIWHSWSSFERLAKAIHYDAAIFSICHNDSHIFESNTVQYNDEFARTWLDGNKLKPILRRTLGELSRASKDRGLRLILAFYSMWEGDAPIVRAVGDECQAIGLPFVDLLGFLKEESGLSIAEFIASPFDGHPSNEGHRAAARRIVDELTKHWQPAPIVGRKLGDRLIDTCDQAVQEGWSPDDIAHWAMLVLDAKEIAVRRSRTDTSPLIEELSHARGNIEQRYRDWYAARVDAAQARMLHVRRDDLETPMERADASLRNLDEMIFVLEHFRDPPIATELWNLIEASGYYNVQGRLLDLPEDLPGQLKTMASSMPGPPAPHVPPLVRQFVQLRRDFDLNLLRLSALLPDRIRSTDIDADLLKLWQVAHYLVKATQSYIDEFEKTIKAIGAGVPTQVPFFTSVDIRVERSKGLAKQGGVFNLTTEIDYIEPRRIRHRCKLWAGADEEAYVYHFEVPLLLLGNVGIGVPSWDDQHKRFLDQELRIAKIEITNSPSGSMQVAKRFVWEPSANTMPAHWLTFDHLLVPT